MVSQDTKNFGGECKFFAKSSVHFCWIYIPLVIEIDNLILLTHLSLSVSVSLFNFIYFVILFLAGGQRNQQNVIQKSH